MRRANAAIASSGETSLRSVVSGLLALRREDVSVNANQGGRIALFVYRLGHALATPANSWAPPKILWLVYRALFVLFSVPQGCQLDPGAQIGRRFQLPHGGNGIVISHQTVIGDDVTLFHQVTLGTKSLNAGAPVIEDGVTVYVGAKIIGPVTIGRGSSIGANAVVVTDVPPGATYAGIPARRV